MSKGNLARSAAFFSLVILIFSIFPMNVELAYAAQFGKPNSDITNPTGKSSWKDGGSIDVDGSLFSSLDEVTADDATSYVESRKNPAITDFIELGLSAVTDPVVDTGHIIKFRAQQSNTNRPQTLFVELYEGATLRATTVVMTLTNAYQTLAYTLSTAEAGTIVDYSNLSLRFVPSTGEGGEKKTKVQLTWAEFEVPDAGASVSATDIPLVSDSASRSVTRLISDAPVITDSSSISVAFASIDTPTISDSASIAIAVNDMPIITDTLLVDKSGTIFIEIEKFVEIKVFDALEVVKAEDIDEELDSKYDVKSQKQDENTLTIIKQWGGYSAVLASDSKLLETVGVDGNYIPSWFKKTAKWIIREQITHQEFADALRYMSDNDILTLKQTTDEKIAEIQDITEHQNRFIGPFHANFL